ncbi:hypothetical protein QVD17_17314 [Tagetes erecta]|uniref:Sulfotransferase n=1 Tax=Tagetes erecta TaxID=13708 RepID=A0AAD8P1B5_TARER|nr:hypothetical protein QVD17_17314 [Tagetes erecta]
MSTENDDEQQNTLQQHAQLLNELPKAEACFMNSLHLYQGIWLYPDALLSVMLMQTRFKHQSTDIFLTSLIKSGTTWLRSLMFTTLNRSRFEFSEHPLLRKGPHDCFPVLDLYKPDNYASIDRDTDVLTPSPRLFATHFAYKLLPSSVTDPSSGCKFVYVCRDPKDMLVSLWHFMVKLRPKEQPLLSFEQVFRKFCEGVIEYGPYWDHVLGFWEASVNSPDKILFLKYEELKRDPEVHVRKLAEFMGVPISVQEEANGTAKKIADFCSFEHLRSLEVNKTGVHRSNNGALVENQVFFRRGEVGDWKCHMTEEMKDEIDRITHDKLKGSGLTLGATPK